MSIMMVIAEKELILKTGKCELCGRTVVGIPCVVHIDSQVSPSGFGRLDYMPYHRGCFEVKRKLLNKFNVEIGTISMKEIERMITRINVQNKMIEKALSTRYSYV